ncbi:MAG: prephenate dehydrogenase [candidate division KSB1 bacterium]|nr:prephenate dehydrogenase [candidate division KSB1 bacterium]MDZ7272827.1 prephenate dehydrogenase [candidate division KSB1 bacterium]MDZ7284150.1 prephenate dehydrogenase [candidate division KSB1 bacterium]MDZ7297452.1 prephenate dehydrogenase [candidate division KSB1 bacterium]MDZ7305588.1 prephenate dehydrogenase [candidate division KSB1 bacterium]
MTEDAFEQQVIAIVGIGLMGGSLALALRERQVGQRILAVDHNPKTCAHARARGLEAVPDLGAVTQADVIILATPVRTIIELLPRVGALARAGALVMDLGSTKRDIVQAMNGLPAHLQVIGGHPLCGKETAGFASADAKLFQNAVFALSPLARTSAATLAHAQRLVQRTGARPLIVEAERHDRILATTSHLPYLLAAALMRVANEQARDEDLLFTLAASGFQDTSRLAASNTTMMLDILMTNRANVTEALRASARQLSEFADLMTNEEEFTLHTILATLANKRHTLFKQPSPIENQKSF